MSVTMKIIFERSSQKGGPQVVRIGLKHRKNSILESRIFTVVAFSPEIQ